MSRKQANSKSRKQSEKTTLRASVSKDREDPRLQAAQKRLRESVDRVDALEALREIVSNLLGCEEMALFTMESGRSGLLWSFGIDPQRHGTLDSFEAASLAHALHGECHIAQMANEASDAGPSLRVFVPIFWNGRIVAVLVMLQLLPQKVGFDQADLKLVKLLSEEAGKALFGRNATAHA
jgi:chemotaxis protein CheD